MPLRRKVIAALSGGLGNQMFQFAAARAFACRVDLPLELALDAYQYYKQHNGFELHSVFPRTRSFEARDSGWLAPVVARYRLISSKLGIAPFSNSEYFFESSPAYSIDIQKIGVRDVVMYGYWQDDNYFKSIREELLADLCFTMPEDPQNLELLNQIEYPESVSVHVRRGDYVSNKSAASVHGVLSLDYYRRAIDLIRSQTNDPKFYIFSDDVSYCRENILPLVPEATIVNHNTGRKSAYDMFLMSKCRFNIIANSSFSWWAGWLNNCPDSQVIAPVKWYADSHKENMILPDSWVRI